jgi:hypothetical protein
MESHSLPLYMPSSTRFNVNISRCTVPPTWDQLMDAKKHRKDTYSLSTGDEENSSSRRMTWALFSGVTEHPTSATTRNLDQDIAYLPQDPPAPNAPISLRGGTMVPWDR